MKFEYISSDRIKVILSAQDIADADIDLQSSDEKDLKRLKKYVFFLLSKIKLPPDAALFQSSYLYVEIYPQRFGGAVIYFIIDSAQNQFCEPITFCFYSSQELINAVVTVFAAYSHRLYKSALYQHCGCWLFTVTPLDGFLSPVTELLCEYGEPIDGGRIISSAIEEHCKPIIRERAADMLAFYFG